MYFYIWIWERRQHALFLQIVGGGGGGHIIGVDEPAASVFPLQVK